jgi:hypothetical protein
LARLAQRRELLVMEVWALMLMLNGKPEDLRLEYRHEGRCIEAARALIEFERREKKSSAPAGRYYFCEKRPMRR